MHFDCFPNFLSLVAEPVGEAPSRVLIPLSPCVELQRDNWLDVSKKQDLLKLCEFPPSIFSLSLFASAHAIRWRTEFSQDTCATFDTQSPYRADCMR